MPPAPTKMSHETRAARQYLRIEARDLRAGCYGFRCRRFPGPTTRGGRGLDGGMRSTRRGVPQEIRRQFLRSFAVSSTAGAHSFTARFHLPLAPRPRLSNAVVRKARVRLGDQQLHDIDERPTVGDDCALPHVARAILGHGECVA